MSERCDLLVVGAGIVGLAVAWAGARRGLSVIVADRGRAAVGASIRNFGFVTVTGQRAGAHWARARRSRDLWIEAAREAGIDIVQQGLYLSARRPEAVAVLEAFAATDMGEDCRLLNAGQARDRFPELKDCRAALYSPHERRVESREAIPRLAAWLQQSHRVRFHWGAAVQHIDLPSVHTSRGTIRADHVVVCPGNELHALYPDHIAAAGIRQCTLQMLRVQPAVPLRMPGALMSDLSLVRYEGFSALPESAPLREVLRREQQHMLDAGIHLIAVQSPDGSMVVGDTHVYGDSEQPFANASWDEWMLDELQRALHLPEARIVERWVGSYASSDEVVFARGVAKGVAIGIVTGGTGASTGFAFGEELLAMALGE